MQIGNSVQLWGRLGGDPEIVQTNSGASIAKFSIATTEFWKDKQTGEKREKTQWHRCVCFGPLADRAERILRKGQKVIAYGKIEYNDTEKDGVKRVFTNIIIGSFQVTDWNEEKSGVADQPRRQANGRRESGPREMKVPGRDYQDNQQGQQDDDLPF